VKTKLELEDEIKKEKLGSEEEDDESSAVAALLFVPTSSMSVNEREERDSLRHSGDETHET